MPTSPPLADPPSASPPEPMAQSPLSHNVGWLIVLGLTAAIVVIGLFLGFQSLRVSEEEREQTYHTQLLTSQLSEVSQELMGIQVQAWTIIGTGSTEDITAFAQYQTQLKNTLARLRAPEELPELRRERLEQLPKQTESYLALLGQAVQLRREGRVGEAVILLQRGRSEGQTLEERIKTLQEGAQDAVRDRQRILENTRIGLRAKMMVHSMLLCLLLVVTYLVLRAERARQWKRERQLQREKQLLKQLTEEDGLTGLHNRRAFDDHLRLEWRRARRYGLPLSILLLDVDHFGNYNKEFGIQVGDEVLRRLAGALTQTARLTDFIARYGGEEFVILLPHTTCEESLIVGERLRTILAHYDWPHRAVTASIGLATMSEKIKDADALVRAADDAMHYAKSHGRDQVIHFNHL